MHSALRFVLVLSVLAGCSLTVWGRQARTTPASPPPRLPRHEDPAPGPPGRISNADPGFLARHCVTCHNARQRPAGLTFEGLDSSAAAANPALFERIARQLRAGTMPPAGTPGPEASARSAYVAAVEATLDRAAGAAPDPGRPVLHRLNRTEYANAIRDLLDVEVDAGTLLPPDESLGGFDNIGGALSMSPMLLERYLAAARRISRLAVGDPTITPAFASRTYSAPLTRFQDARMGDDLPFGSRGGLAVRHEFPLDGEYVVRISLARNIAGYIRGLAEPHQLEVRLDKERLVQFTVGGNGHGLAAPLGFTGVIAGDPGWESWALTADDELEVHFAARAGRRLIGVSFLDEPVEEEGVRQPRLTGLGFSYSEYASAPEGRWGPAVGSVTIDGPYRSTSIAPDTRRRARIFRCRPTGAADERACAARIVAPLARLAYRRPPTDADIRRLLESFDRGSVRGGFDAGIQAAIERLLIDPYFLFRVERDPAGVAQGTAHPVSGLELASRLSFFLWSSIPDEPLLGAAIAGRLQSPAELRSQVRRMLADPRASALVSAFAAQWLSLRQLRDVTPDPELFPEFDDGLRAAFETETTLFLESQLREDRPVTELLTAGYTFVNERLARHYGIPNVYGSHFRRVRLAGRERAGLLGHGSILTLTAYPTRTSPVVRGRWLLDSLLGSPPPPPPANVPALPPATDSTRVLSMRERTERHRRNPVCAGCHVRMDPLGFSLEHYDPIGRWRAVSEAGTPIDATGSLPDGTTFAGPEGLRNMVAGRRDEFARTVAEKLMTHALGRLLEPADGAAVRAVVRSAPDLRWSSLVAAVASSVPFQMRRAAP
ncbi:MAG: DUF1592 domain-containing protein [Vicinamibacterales bacterium]|nr:DUF1592 domain-containing protein [Vicinamibacterales bacterium]